MKTPRRSAAPRLLLAAALGLGAGGACSNPVDTSENKLPYLSEQDTVVVDTTPADVDPGGCACLAPGQWFKFDTLALTSIDGLAESPVISILNGMWATDIGRGEISILLEVTAVTPTEVTMRVVNGKLRDDGSDVCESEPSSATMVFPRQGCRLLPSGETSFNVYAGTESYPKNCAVDLPVQHVIPVSRAVLAGTVSESCDAITAGEVPSGVLGKAEVSEVCTCINAPTPQTCLPLDPTYDSNGCNGCNAKYKRLDDLLISLTMGEGFTWSCATAAGDPATCLTASWSAARLPTDPPACAE